MALDDAKRAGGTSSAGALVRTMVFSDLRFSILEFGFWTLDFNLSDVVTITPRDCFVNTKHFCGVRRDLRRVGNTAQNMTSWP